MRLRPWGQLMKIEVLPSLKTSFYKSNNNNKKKQSHFNQLKNELRVTFNQYFMHCELKGKLDNGSRFMIIFELLWSMKTRNRVAVFGFTYWVTDFTSWNMILKWPCTVRFQEIQRALNQLLCYDRWDYYSSSSFFHSFTFFSNSFCSNSSESCSVDDGSWVTYLIEAREFRQNW